MHLLSTSYCSGKLFEYVGCISTIRSHCAGVSSRDEERLSECIENAMDECIEKGYLADILIKERSEVFNMFLNGCTIEEFKEVQILDKMNQVAEAKAEIRKQVTEQGVKAQVNNLKPFLNDINAVTEAIKKNEGFENVTPEMVKKYL